MARRAFLKSAGLSLGSVALASLLNDKLFAAGAGPGAAKPLGLGVVNPLHFAPRAKRVIYLFMSGAPSQIDLYDPKPKLRELTGQLLPESIRMGQRITGMTSGQKYLLCVGSPFEFKRHGKCEMEISELLPNIGGVADDIALLRAVHTDPINHDPAVTYLFSGTSSPAVRRWVRGSLMGWAARTAACPRSSSCIPAGADSRCKPVIGAMASSEQPPRRPVPRTRRSGVVHYRSAQLSQDTPPDAGPSSRRSTGCSSNNWNDPEIATRIDAYEMAFRMQTSVPELMDISKEPKETLEMHGAEPGKPSFANNCPWPRLRNAVRFVKLLHRDWDHHGGLAQAIREQASQTDKASAALIKDLKQRGLSTRPSSCGVANSGAPYSQGNISERELWPRPSSPLLQPLDGRRRNQRRRRARHDG